MTWSSLALDIGALLVLAFCAAFYARRGFLSGLFSFFGTLLAMVAAILLARWLAPILFEHLFRPGIETKMTEAIAGQQATDTRALLEAVLGFLPGGALDSLAGSLDSAVDLAAPGVAAAVVEQVVAPLVVPFIVAILFFVLFLVARLLVMALRTLARGINHVPVISTVNSALGAVMGILVGALYVFLALCLLWAIDALNPEISMGERYFAHSVLYNLLGIFNLFS